MVTMYTTTWCGHCLRLKTVLGRENIPFREVDIEQNDVESAFAESQAGLFNCGYRGCVQPWFDV